MAFWLQQWASGWVPGCSHYSWNWDGLDRSLRSLGTKRGSISLQSCMPLYLSGTGTKLCLQALPGPPTFKRYPPRLNQVPVFPFVPFIPFPAHACSVKKGFIEYILDVRPCVGETEVRKRNFHYQGNHSIVRETHVQR